MRLFWAFDRPRFGSEISVLHTVDGRCVRAHQQCPLLSKFLPRGAKAGATDAQLAERPLCCCRHARRLLRITHAAHLFWYQTAVIQCPGGIE